MNKLYILFLVAIVSCHSRTVTFSLPGNTEGQATNKILFLAYEVTRDSLSGRISTRILYQRLAEGTVKPGSLPAAEAINGNWQIDITGIKDNLLESIILENPLHKHMEYVAADGGLGTRQVWLSRDEVVIRTNYKKGMHTVELREITDDKKNRIIFTHSITPQNN